jgi:hypothetical protein
MYGNNAIYIYIYVKLTCCCWKKRCVIARGTAGRRSKYYIYIYIYIYGIVCVCVRACVGGGRF